MAPYGCQNGHSYTLGGYQEWLKWRWGIQGLLKVAPGMPGSEKNQHGPKRTQDGSQRPKDGPQRPPKEVKS